MSLNPDIKNLDDALKRINKPALKDFRKGLEISIKQRRKTLSGTLDTNLILRLLGEIRSLESLVSKINSILSEKM